VWISRTYSHAQNFQKVIKACLKRMFPTKNIERNTQLVLRIECNKGIMRVPAKGGKPETIVAVTETECAHGPQVLPGGNAVLFTLAKPNQESWDKASIVVQKIFSSERKTLIEGGTNARYVSTGHIVYALAGSLLAVPFDLKRLEITGAAIPIVEGVARADNSGAAHFSFSDTGTLVYIPGTLDRSIQSSLAMVDRNGVARTIGIPSGSHEFPRISPNGKQLAFDLGDTNGYSVYVYELSGASSIRRLTFDGSNRGPLWSGDGERILFQSSREGDSGIFWQRADGAGSVERLTKSEKGTMHVPSSWPPKTQKFVFDVYTASMPSLWTYSLQDRKASVFGSATSDSIGLGASFSPDGRWLAYQSWEGGKPVIFIQPFPAAGARYQITKGTHPLWSPDGKELFYVGIEARLYSVAVRTQAAFTFANPSPLPINGVVQPTLGPRNYDITPDGKRFIVVFPPGQNSAEPHPA
jgi:eukaryotic-like serine/threonine-protein kinase